MCLDKSGNQDSDDSFLYFLKADLLNLIPSDMYELINYIIDIEDSFILDIPDNIAYNMNSYNELYSYILKDSLLDINTKIEFFKYIYSKSDKNLFKNYKFNLMEKIYYVLNVEKKYNLKIPESASVNFKTPNDLYEYLIKNAKTKKYLKKYYFWENYIKDKQKKEFLENIDVKTK